MSAMTQFLGISGSALEVDVLKVGGRECWIRVQREDLSAIVAGCGGWRKVVGGVGVGWRVVGYGNWLGVLGDDAGFEEVWSG